jgi:uncharacterized NAD-dependent epimerase/dehydratase family protein
MEKEEIRQACEQVTYETGLPAFDVLEYGAGDLVRLLKPLLK